MSDLNKQSPAPAARFAELRIWFAACVLVPTLLLASAAYYDRSVILCAARDRMLSTTDALAAHAQTVFETAELTISLQLEFVRGMDWQTISRSEAVHQLLVQLDRELPQIDSAFFVDPEGYNSASSRAFPMPRFDVHDREYYRLAREGDAGLVVSAPFSSRSHGDLGFTVSRARITDGKFNGIAAVTMSPKYFQELYRSMLTWPDAASAMLLRADGTILAEFPAAANAPGRFGNDAAVLAAARMRKPISAFEMSDPVTGRTLLSAGRWLPGREVLVFYSIDKRRALSQWYLHLALFATFALMATLALLLTVGTTLRRAALEQANLKALVTETRRRQDAEAALHHVQKLDALGRLTGGIAHDFNNLLAAIIGSIELSLRRVSDERTVRLLNAAREAATRGARLAAQMLAFARRQPLELQPVDVNHVLLNMRELLARSIGPLVQVEYKLAPDLRPALANAVQVEMAVLNLAVNARDAMPADGRVTITTAEITTDHGERVVISVRDTGQGMSEAVLANAFEPFFTTKEAGKGTGLGLSMVYGFARQAGGTVTIESAPGEGTEVQVMLPLAGGPIAPPIADAPETAPAIHGLRVLLVDDDEAVRTPTKELLHERGFTVIDVDSGPKALALLRSGQQFDVLLADFAMSGMNGAELASAARTILPDLPIVFLTGYAEAGVLQRWAEAGTPIIIKPCSMQTLSAALMDAAQGSGHTPSLAVNA